MIPKDEKVDLGQLVSSFIFFDNIMLESIFMFIFKIFAIWLMFMVFIVMLLLPFSVYPAIAKNTNKSDFRY
jgi:predicted membrane metal-binding protein